MSLKYAPLAFDYQKKVTLKCQTKERLKSRKKQQHEEQWKKIVQILFYRCRYRCFVSQIIYTINRDTASPEGGSVCLGDMILPHLKEVSPVIMM